MNYQNILLNLSKEITVGDFTYMLRHSHHDDQLTSIEMVVHKITNGVQAMLGIINIEYGVLSIASYPFDTDITTHIAFLSDYYNQAKNIKAVIVDHQEANI